MADSTTTDTLDRLIHERIRLGIVSALAAEERMSFADLKQVLRTSDGNLSVHARKLALETYLAQMETILSEARDALERT
jgi:hypothetical protein